MSPSFTILCGNRLDGELPRVQRRRSALSTGGGWKPWRLASRARSRRRRRSFPSRSADSRRRSAAGGRAFTDRSTVAFRRMRLGNTRRNELREQQPRLVAACARGSGITMCSPREPDVLSAARRPRASSSSFTQLRHLDDAIEGRARPGIEIENRVVHRRRASRGAIPTDPRRRSRSAPCRAASRDRHRRCARRSRHHRSPQCSTRITGGTCSGGFCWKNTSPLMPSGVRLSTSGRSGIDGQDLRRDARVVAHQSPFV